jgi:hypothetical protein
MRAAFILVGILDTRWHGVLMAAFPFSVDELADHRGGRSNTGSMAH